MAKQDVLVKIGGALGSAVSTVVGVLAGPVGIVLLGAVAIGAGLYHLLRGAYLGLKPQMIGECRIVSVKRKEYKRI